MITIRLIAGWLWIHLCFVEGSERGMGKGWDALRWYHTLALWNKISLLRFVQIRMSFQRPVLILLEPIEWSDRLLLSSFISLHSGPLSSEAKPEVWIRSVINALIKAWKSTMQFYLAASEERYKQETLLHYLYIFKCILSTDVHKMFFLFFVRGNIGPPEWSDARHESWRTIL